MYPAINLHHLYSLHLYDELDIIFEDMKMLDNKVLNKVAETKELGDIHLVPDILSINTIEKFISIVGYKINNNTYILNHNGVNVKVHYTCSEKDILTAIEYLYQMYRNIIIKNDDVIDYKWDPKPYKPEQ